METGKMTFYNWLCELEAAFDDNNNEKVDYMLNNLRLQSHAFRRFIKLAKLGESTQLACKAEL